jgi:hypothetical protein
LMLIRTEVSITDRQSDLEDGLVPGAKRFSSFRLSLGPQMMRRPSRNSSCSKQSLRVSGLLRAVVQAKFTALLTRARPSAEAAAQALRASDFGIVRVPCRNCAPASSSRPGRRRKLLGSAADDRVARAITYAQARASDFS